MPRNILIDPQRLGTGKPNIQFSGSIDNQVKLEVADLGDLNFKNDVTGNSILFISGSGQIGIGISVSSDKLAVVGTVSVTGSYINPGQNNSTALGSTSKSWSNVVSTAFSGSLTRLSDGTTPYLLAGTNVSISTGSNGQITISSAAPAGTVTGTGTTNFLTKWTGASSIGDSVISSVGTEIGASGSLLPGIDINYDLGSLAKRWRNIFATSISGSLTGSNLANGMVLFAGATGGITGSQSQFFWDNTNSRLGIRTSSPSYPLDVSGDAYLRNLVYVGSGQAIRNVGGAGSVYFMDLGRATFRDGTGANLGGILEASSLYVGTSYWGTALANGNAAFASNVGIGTTNPDAKLTLSGSSDLATFYNSSGTKQLTVQNSGDLSFNTSTTLGLVWGNANLKFNGQLNGVQVVPFSSAYVGFSVTGKSSQTYALQTWQNSAGTVLSVVDANGSVGLGVTTVSSPLTTRLIVSGSSVASNQTMLVKAGTATQTGPVFEVEDVLGATLLIVSGSGNVGVGTGVMTNHGAGSVNFAVNASSNALIDWMVNGTRTASAYAQGSITNFGTITATPLAFITQNTERARIDGTGNVGIGVTNPAARLQVNNALQIGDWTQSTTSLRFSRSVSTIQADSAYRVDPSNTPIHSWVEGGFLTGERAGTVTAPNSGRAYYEEYFGNSTSTYKSFGFINQTSGSNFNTTHFTSSITLRQDGNVGIGTTSPQTILHISGSRPNIRLQNSTGATSTWELFAGDATVGDTRFGIRDVTTASARMVINNSGLIGIGTTNPSILLHADNSASTSSSAWIIGSIAATTGYTGLKVINTNTAGRSLIVLGEDSLTAGGTPGAIERYGSTHPTSPNLVNIYSSGPIALLSGPSGIERVRVLAGGTTAFTGSVEPGNDLQHDLGSTTKRWNNIYAVNISGSLTGSNLTAGQVVVAGTGGILSGTNQFVWDNTNSRIGIGTATPSYTLDARVSGNTVANLGGVGLGGALYFGNGASQIGHGNNEFGFYTLQNRGITFNPNNTFAMSIVPAGRVGIGGTNPLARFEVTGSGSSTGATAHFINSSGTSLMFVRDDGYVGIGTNTPTVGEKLSVIGNLMVGQGTSNTTSAFIQLTSGGSSYSSIIDFGYHTGVFDASMWNMGRDSNGQFVINDTITGNANIALAIQQSTRNIGIGTNTTSARLIVSGSATASTPTMIVREGVVSPLGGVGVFDVQNYVNTSLFFVSGSGNIGIGTTSNLLGRVHLNAGNLYIDGTAGAFSTATYNNSVYSRIVFDNDYSDVARGPNRITLHDVGNWMAGFGIHAATMAYYSGDNHAWYRMTSTTPSLRMTLDSSGVLTPGSNNTQDIGTSGTRWRDLYARSGSFSGDLTISGDLTVMGTSSIINSEIVNIKDNAILLNAGPSPLNFGGVYVADNTVNTTGSIIWDASTDRWKAGFVGSEINIVTTGSSDTLRNKTIPISGVDPNNISGGTAWGAGFFNGSGNLASTAAGTSGQLLQSNGTSAPTWVSPSSVITTNSIITGSGTTNFVSKFTSGNAIGNSSIFDNGTSVGINQSSPTSNARLDVNGSVRVTGNFRRPDDAGVALTVGDGTETHNQDTVVFNNAVGNTTFARLNSTGLIVGSTIGATAASVALDVSGTIRTGGSGLNGRLLFTRSDGQNVGQIFNSGSTGLTLEQGGGGSFISLNVGNGSLNGSNPERVRIDGTTGNVGIGTTSPDQQLDVRGNIAMGRRAQATVTRYVGLTNTDGTFSSVAGQGTTGMVIDQHSGGDSSIRFRTGTWGVSEDIRMMIDRTGNVGIGTTVATNATYSFSAGGGLSIYNGTQATVRLSAPSSNWDLGSNNNSLYFYDATNTTERMRINGSGNIGVGTATYTARLHVSGSSTATASTLVARSGLFAPSSAILDIQDTIGTSMFWVSGSSGTSNVYIKDNLYMGPGSSVATRFLLGVDNGGNPYHQSPSIHYFMVNGVYKTVINTNGVTINNSSLGASAGMGLVVASGNVGIGTTTTNGSANLEVNSGGATASLANIYSSPSAYTTNMDLATLAFGSTNGGNNIPAVTLKTINESNASSANSALIISTRLTSVVAEKMRINSTGHVTPGTDNSQDLGSTSLRWRNVYATSISGSLTGSNVSAGQVVVAGTGGVLSGSNNFVWDNSNNRVGIGTSSPAERFHVNAGSSVPVRLVSSGFSGIEYHNTEGTPKLYIGTETGGGGARYNSLDSQHTFYNNGSNVLRINSSNHLVPGANSTQDLGSTSLYWRNLYASNISGSFTGSNLTAGQVVITGTGGLLSGSNNFWWNNSTNQVGIGTSAIQGSAVLQVNRASGGNLPQIALTNSSVGGAVHWIGTGWLNDGLGSVDTLSIGNNQQRSVSIISANASVLTVVDDGTKKKAVMPQSNSYIGIGTTDPTATLQVIGHTSAGTAAAAIIREGVVSQTGGLGVLDVQNSAATSLLFVSGSGVVGIGTTGPFGTNCRLNVQLAGTTRSNYTAPTNAGFLLDCGTSANGAISMVGGGSLGYYFTNSTAAYDAGMEISSRVLTFRAGNASRVSIDTSGNTTPAVDNTQSLGSSTLRWANIHATIITSSGSLAPAYTSATSTTGTTAIFDTISVASDGAVYELMIIGNPNSAAGSAYRDVIYGKIIIGTGFNGTAARNYIQFVNESPAPRSIYPASSAGLALTADAVYFQSGSELTDVAQGSTATIRVKVLGYNAAGVAGNGTTVRLKQLA